MFKPIALLFAFFSPSLLLLGGSGGGPGSTICCYTEPETGGVICHWPEAGSCDPGDKAVICRYGVTDLGGGSVVCSPGS